MNFPADIERYVLDIFGQDQFETVLDLLRNAKLHDGQPAGDRLIRCAVVASGDSISMLEHMVELMAIDFRDVIVAGEYETEDGELVQARDLTAPFFDYTAEH